MSEASNTTNLLSTAGRKNPRRDTLSRLDRRRITWHFPLLSDPFRSVAGDDDDFSPPFSRFCDVSVLVRRLENVKVSR